RGFSPPILSEILIVLVYKGTLPLYMISYSLNFMRAEYNGGIGIPNNSESFCGARKIGILADFPFPFSPKF
ncbi:MAG: hypothetical protein O4859_29790, partial [Trichodesmium sp. St18_bin1]|nr:hypothetical protein [Trichodesmium sp. St18_bin1]